MDVQEYENLIEQIELLHDVRLAEKELSNDQGISHESAKKKIMERLKQWKSFGHHSLDRLAEISDYISLDKPNAAIDWVDSIFNSVENLKSFPESGRKVPSSQLLTPEDLS